MCETKWKRVKTLLFVLSLLFFITLVMYDKKIVCLLKSGMVERA